MYNQQTFFQAIKAFTGQGNMLVVPLELLRFLEDTNAAILLSQLIYWQERSNGWVYKTYPEWQSELSLTEYQVRRASNKLEQQGFLSTKIKKANGNPTVHYHVNWDTFSDSFLKFLQNRNESFFRNETEVSSDSLTEPTTKPTTEPTSKDILSDSTGQPSHSHPNQVSEIIFHLNQKCGTNFRDSSKKTKQLIQARLHDGFTLDDFKTVIDKKAADWLVTEWEKFLRPETLFGTKFESYLNEKVGVKRGNWKHSRQVSSTRREKDGRTFGVVKR